MDNFRKIDIDQYDEDRLEASELYEVDPRDPAEVLDEAKQRQTAVRSSLARCVVPRCVVTVAETDECFAMSSNSPDCCFALRRHFMHVLNPGTVQERYPRCFSHCVRERSV